MSNTLVLSEKYKDFLKCDVPVEFLEGTTAAGKTTVGVFKWMLKVSKSPKKLHIISGLDIGTLEKNVIQKDLGILDLFGNARESKEGLVEYYGAGTRDYKMPHLVFHTPKEDKIILVLGYDDKNRWKKALGGQYGCLYIDEINIANMEYVREASMRCDYLMGTLNPDDPSLPIYKEYINHSRPLKKYKDDGPIELRRELCESHKRGWVWWYFSFEHNAGLSKEKVAQIVDNVPVGTKLYKNKILGLRTKATGLVFSNFNREKHCISPTEIKEITRKPMTSYEKRNKEHFVEFSVGLDTSYSAISNDTIAMTFLGITNMRRCILLEEKIYNNKDSKIPIAPSDTVVNFINFIQKCEKKYECSVRNTYIDSADQATITEFIKYKREHFNIYYSFNNAWKKMKIVDRINTQLGWFQTMHFFVANYCNEYIREMETYSWKEDKDNEPEDKNDHLINSCQYAWIPYKMKIGNGE